MKKLAYTAILILLCACSGSYSEDTHEALGQTRGEWTHEQTEKAIDLYLDGLKQQEALIDREMELQHTLKFFDENRCSRDVLKARSRELQDARARIRHKRDSLTLK